MPENIAVEQVESVIKDEPETVMSAQPPATEENVAAATFTNPAPQDEAHAIS